MKDSQERLDKYILEINGKVQEQFLAARTNTELVALAVVVAFPLPLLGVFLPLTKVIFLETTVLCVMSCTIPLFVALKYLCI